MTHLVAFRAAPLALAITLAFMTAGAHAQSSAASGTLASSAVRTYHIAAGTLGNTLVEIARQGGMAISVNPDLVKGLDAPAINGDLRVEQAVQRALAQHPLELLRTSNGTLTVGRKAGADARESGSTLPLVNVVAATAVEDARGKVDGYVAKRSATGTKTDTPLLEIPQSISVIGRSEMEARGAQNLMDIVGYTPGISVNTYGPDNRGTDDIALRGFPDYSSNYRDGLPQSAFETVYRLTEPYGLERVDVLRGPASVMFGQGDAGGVINRASKLPSGERAREIEVQYGSFNRKQVAFDIDDKVSSNEDLSYRLVGLVLDSNDQDKYPDGTLIKRSRYYFAPSVKWKPNAGTSLTLTSEFLQHDSGEDPYYAIDANSNLTNRKMGDYSFSNYKLKQGSVGYQFEHELNDSWKLRQNARFSDVRLERRVLWLDELQPDNHTYSRYTRSWNDQAQQAVIDTNVQGKLRTGAVQHTVLLGVDWNQLKGKALRYRGTGPDLDLLNPQYGLPVATPDNLTGDFSQKTTQLGVYAQDQIKFGEHWVATVGGRQDHVKSTTDNRLNATVQEKSDSAFSGRAGLTYLVGNGWAPYISYAESFLPVSGLDSNNNPFKPSRGKQVEAGIKFQPANSRTVLSAAIFDLRKTNVVNFDPIRFVNRQIGKQRSRGLELEAKTELARGLNMVASYTRLDLKVLESADSSEVGKVPPTIPKEIATLWLDYELGGGYGFGGGMHYVGKRQNDEANTSAQGSYALLNAMFRYDQGQWRLTVNAGNLLNRDYYSICYHGECYRGAERTLTATLKYRF
ncbi:Ferrichrome-iron receptor precursor [compost metagenome]